MSRKVSHFGRQGSTKVKQKSSSKYTLALGLVILAYFSVLILETQSSAYYLAEAIYYESRDEPAIGRRAVAGVILNRVDDPDWPNTVEMVVKDGEEREHLCDFSYQCDGKPENPWLHGFRFWPAWIRSRIEGHWYYGLYRLNIFSDPTGGALYYKRKDAPSGWFQRRIDDGRFIVVPGNFGAHEFYWSS